MMRGCWLVRLEQILGDATRRPPCKRFSHQFEAEQADAGLTERKHVARDDAVVPRRRTSET